MMAESDLEKLLGGFSADTLTNEERQQLFAAALDNQELFNALADEQALKELLADPIVRRRLLQTLAHPPSAERWRLWLDRFTRPAGLAWAGGVAVAVFAVVLGLKVYQDAARQAADRVAVEEVQPIAPSTTPQAAPPEQTPSPLTPERPANDTMTTVQPREKPEQVEKRRRSDQKESQKADAPVGTLGKSPEQTASDRRPAPSSPPALESEGKALGPAGDGAITRPSARALFHGQLPAPEMGMARETDAAQKSKQFALRKTFESTASVKPLALRYSLVAGEEAERSGAVTLRIETNQEGYLQIWRRSGDALPQLMLPAKESGHISLRTAADEPQRIAVPSQTDQLIVRLSRVPFGPISRQEAVMAGRGSATQVTESVSAAEEQSTYVANPDLSAAELSFEIPLTAQTPR
jgi:hypothetical protein